MNTDLLNAATIIANGYLSRNLADPAEIPDIIEGIARALHTVGSMSNDPVHVIVPLRDPAVPIEESIHDDYLVCLEDGAKVKTLKRYIRGRFGLSPEQYRERWNLPVTYPMAAPEYSRRRREIARTAKGGFRKAA